MEREELYETHYYYGHGYRICGNEIIWKEKHNRRLVFRTIDELYRDTGELAGTFVLSQRSEDDEYKTKPNDPSHPFQNHVITVNLKPDLISGSGDVMSADECENAKRILEELFDIELEWVDKIVGFDDSMDVDKSKLFNQNNARFYTCCINGHTRKYGQRLTSEVLQLDIDAFMDEWLEMISKCLKIDQYRKKNLNRYTYDLTGQCKSVMNNLISRICSYYEVDNLSDITEKRRISALSNWSKVVKNHDKYEYPRKTLYYNIKTHIQ